MVLLLRAAAVLAVAAATALAMPLPKLANSASFTVQGNILEKQYTVNRMELYSHKQAKMRIDTIERSDREYSYAFDVSSGDSVTSAPVRPKEIQDHEHDEGRTRDLRQIVDFNNGHYYRADIYASTCNAYLMKGVQRECEYTDPKTGKRTAYKDDGEETTSDAPNDKEEDKKKGHGNSAFEGLDTGIDYECHWAGVPPMTSTAQMFHWGSQFPEQYLGVSYAVEGIRCNRWQTNITGHGGKNYTLDYYFVDESWRQHINRREAESLPEGYGIPARAVLRSVPLTNLEGGKSEEMPTFSKPLGKGDVYHIYDFHDYVVGEPASNIAFLLPCEYRENAKSPKVGINQDDPAGGILGNCTDIINMRCYEQPGIRRGTRQEAAFIGGVLGALLGICCTACLMRRTGKEKGDSSRALI